MINKAPSSFNNFFLFLVLILVLICSKIISSPYHICFMLAVICKHIACTLISLSISTMLSANQGCKNNLLVNLIKLLISANRSFKIQAVRNFFLLVRKIHPAVSLLCCNLGCILSRI